MKVILCFSSIQEFSLFICSRAIFDFDFRPSQNINLQEYLMRQNCNSLLDLVSEVAVADATYSISKDDGDTGPVVLRVTNFMLNETQFLSDNLWIVRGLTQIEGVEKVRECIETLPHSFSLRVGWRTEYTKYVFRHK